eukprot:1134494-Pelagomonas_calceolata.AAC.8
MALYRHAELNMGEGTAHFTAYFPACLWPVGKELHVVGHPAAPAGCPASARRSISTAFCCTTLGLCKQEPPRLFLQAPPLGHLFAVAQLQHGREQLQCSGRGLGPEAEYTGQQQQPGGGEGGGPVPGGAISAVPDRGRGVHQRCRAHEPAEAQATPRCVWKAAGMDLSRVEFLSSSEEINKRPDEYWTLVMDIARKNNLKRILRCSQIMGRSETDDLSAAQIFYPCMQCADVFFLRADICQLGMDQRKHRHFRALNHRVNYRVMPRLLEGWSEEFTP